MNNIVNEVNQIVKEDSLEKNLLSNMSFQIERGEFVAIVGCSGAGKSTLMNVLSGYTKPTSGEIIINNMDVVNDVDTFKGKIAYVPQEEILDSTLTLRESLEYSILLKVKGLTKRQKKRRINKVTKFFELKKQENTLIQNLSGGEKKRASIAAEMLSNPEVYLLDEPCSGLDSNIEKKIMHQLKNLSETNKTVIITAHTVSNLYLCDKIIFIGKDGRICYFGSYEDIFKYFKVKEFVDIYDVLKEDTDTWHEKYLKKLKMPDLSFINIRKEKAEKVSFISQTITLVRRYINSLLNNKMMLGLLLGQAPIMALAVCLALERNAFTDPQASMTIIAGLSFAAIWLGLFNSIQEIVKERNILKKEYMNGLSFASYLTSKIIAFSILCLIQSTIIFTIIYFYLDPRPTEILLFSPYFDALITFFMISFSSCITGILVSSVVKDAKSTLIFAPIYMMFQLLFSGTLLPFNNFTRKISYFIISRWGVEGFGTIFNFAAVDAPNIDKSFYVFEISHLIKVWGILGFIMLIFFIFSILVIKKSVLSRKL